MLPATWRRIFARKLIITILVALVTFYIACAQLREGKPVKKVRKLLAYLESPRMQLEQNGDYWIYNNFLRSQYQGLIGNNSITLTTHGTFRDFKFMKWILARWSGPISMSVYVQSKDLQRTQKHLYYIKYCTSLSMAWVHYVSMHLVFPNKEIPRLFQKMSNNRPRALRCNNFWEKFQSALKSYPKDFAYPLHLMKNVARLNAETFYVLPLEPGMLPTTHFVSTFLQFAYYYHPRNPHKSVYCIPVFPQISTDSLLPTYKSQLVEQFKPYLDGRRTLSSTDQKQLEKLRSWIFNPVRDGDMTVYSESKMPDNCAVYVSSNAFDPFYDQRHLESIYDTNSTKLQVMVGLGFDFIVLDGTFLIYRNSSLQRKYLIEEPSPYKQDHIRQLIKLNSFILYN